MPRPIRYTLSSPARPKPSARNALFTRFTVLTSSFAGACPSPAAGTHVVFAHHAMDQGSRPERGNHPSSRWGFPQMGSACWSMARAARACTRGSSSVLAVSNPDHEDLRRDPCGTTRPRNNETAHGACLGGVPRKLWQWWADPAMSGLVFPGRRGDRELGTAGTTRLVTLIRAALVPGARRCGSGPMPL